MKKTVRMLGLCALVALAFTACKKNDTNGKVKFTATINQPSSNERTYIANLDANGSKVLRWAGGEEINLFNKALTENNHMPFVVLDYNNKHAYFEGDSQFLAGMGTPNNYIAFYPNAVENTDGLVEMTIPDQQSYSMFKVANEIYPMYGFNTTDYNIDFHSHVGVLGLRFRLDPGVYGNYESSVEIPLQKIILTGFNNAGTGDADVLAGTMVYDLDGNYTMVNTGNVIELTGGSLNNQNFTEFDFILPEGALANGFTVQIIRDNGTSITYEGKSVSEGGQAIVAERITYMPEIYVIKTFE